MNKKINTKNQGFKTPNNYFNGFSDEIKTRIYEEKLKEKFGKKNPFSVPDTYFENFIPKNENKKQKSQKIFEILKPYLTIAAGIVVVIAMWQFILSKTNVKTTVINKEETTIGNKQNFDEYDMLELYSITENYIYEGDIVSLSEPNEEETKFEINANEDEISNFLTDYSDDYDINEILASL